MYWQSHGGGNTMPLTQRLLCVSLATLREAYLNVTLAFRTVFKLCIAAQKLCK